MTGSTGRGAARALTNSAARWEECWRRGQLDPPSKPSEFRQDQFFVLINECMGTPPLCFNDYTMPAAFEDPRDAIAYYRHLGIPRLLAILTDRPEDAPREPAEGYLAAVDEEVRPRVVTLLAAFDRALAAQAIPDSDIKDLIDTFNEVFSQPPVESRVLAYGTIADMLAADTYAGDFEDYDTDEPDPDWLPWIWANGKFDPSDPRHFALAVEFIEDHPKF